jgi:hypothetical protein
MRLYGFCGVWLTPWGGRRDAVAPSLQASETMERSG